MRIAITRADGGLSIMQILETVRTPNGEWVRDLFDDAEIEAEIAKSITKPEHLPVQSWRRIVDADIPQDRYFRNAWEDTGAVIEPERSKAEKIHMDAIRAARKPELERLDVEVSRALAQARSAEVAALEAERQKLRDLPQTLSADFAAAGTTDELKAIWPASLPKPPELAGA